MGESRECSLGIHIYRNFRSTQKHAHTFPDRDTRSVQYDNIPLFTCGQRSRSATFIHSFTHNPFPRTLLSTPLYILSSTFAMTLILNYTCLTWDIHRPPYPDSEHTHTQPQDTQLHTNETYRCTNTHSPHKHNLDSLSHTHTQTLPQTHR